MTSYDLIWHLIELLLKDKETKSDDKSQKIRNNLCKGVSQLHSCFFVKN